MVDGTHPGSSMPEKMPGEIMIFYTKYKIEDLFCPRCESSLYRSTYFEHYPEYPYGCVKCGELVAEKEAKRLPPENTRPGPARETSK